MRLLTLAVVVAGLFASFTEAFAGIRDPVYGSLVPPPTSGNSLANVPTQWFKNYVNHFDPQDTRQFLQRVYENREFYDATKDAVSKDAPVFIFLGGEGALTNSWVSQGLMHDYGKKFGAILLGIEHRYYGESVPTNDLSTENLQYLTSEQAIEDVVTYIRNYLKTKLPWNRSRSVVAFGGSYAGTLVGLLRARHPSFIRGAVSSSGPYEPQVDFSEFLEVSTEALRIYGADECVENVRTATELVNTLLSSGTASSYSMLSTDLQTCIPITKMTELDKQNFWFLFSDAMGEIPQYNKENGPGLTVAKVCTRLSDAKRAAGNMGLYKEYMMIFRETQSSSCFPWSYREMIQTLGNTRKGNGMMRQWIYQTCTEWGFYQTTTSANQVFGPTGALTVDYFSAVCQDAYDKSFTTAYIHESTERTRDAYGGWYFQATNVAMANGNIDPWYKLSFFEKCGKRDPSVSIHFSERTAHCAILYPAKPYDLPSLKTARIEIAEQIEKWISTKY